MWRSIVSLLVIMQVGACTGAESEAPREAAVNNEQAEAWSAYGRENGITVPSYGTESSLEEMEDGSGWEESREAEEAEMERQREEELALEDEEQRVRDEVSRICRHALYPEECQRADDPSEAEEIVAEQEYLAREGEDPR